MSGILGWLTQNKHFRSPIRANRFRRLSIGAWGSPSDPTIYGVVEVNAEKALAFIERVREKTGIKVTLTHFVGKVFARILATYPELNCELRFGSIYPRDSIDISFQVALDPKIKGGSSDDLSAGLVKSVHSKNIVEVAQTLNEGASTIRKQKDPFFGRLKKISFSIPGILLRPSVVLLDFFLNKLNLWSPAFGIPKNAFGSMLITNVGTMGVEFALPALFPPSGTPMIIALGAIYSAPVYEADSSGVVTQIRLAPHVRLCGAFDHRYLDGLHGAKIANMIKECFKDLSWIESDESLN